MDLKPLPPIYRGPRGSGEITALAAWARQELLIPSGLRAGQPFELELVAAEISQGSLALQGSSKLAFPLPEKMEKPACFRLSCLAHLIGPLRSRDWRGLVVSAIEAIDR